MTTKFNIGQSVYAVSKDTIIYSTIEYISIDFNGTIQYLLKDHDYDICESSLFTDKLEALKHWMELNNIHIEPSYTSSCLTPTALSMLVKSMDLTITPTLVIH